MPAFSRAGCSLRREDYYCAADCVYFRGLCIFFSAPSQEAPLKLGALLRIPASSRHNSSNYKASFYIDGSMYHWNPGDYEKNSSAQERAAEATLSRIELRGDESILDIGCGDGKITAKIAALVPQGSIKGIDSSPEMIDFARKRYPSTQFPNLSFSRVDAQNLDYNREFDLVLSFACLHWVKDHVAVIRGIKQSLKPAGKMIIQCGGRGIGDDIFTLTRMVMKGDKWSRYFQGYSNPHGIYGADDYHAWLKQIGLDEINVSVNAKDMVLPGRTGLEGFIRTTWLSLKERIPEDLREQFIAEIAERYLSIRPLEGGLAKVRMAVLEVEARQSD